MNYIDRMKERLQGRWIKGELIDKEGNVCLMGSAYYLGNNYTEAIWHRIRAWQTLDKVILENYPDRVKNFQGTIEEFNDHPDTTEEDVVAVLEKASARYDELWSSSETVSQQSD